MERWRERGFVPDSDDEDEFEIPEQHESQSAAIVPSDVNDEQDGHQSVTGEGEEDGNGNGNGDRDEDRSQTASESTVIGGGAGITDGLPDRDEMDVEESQQEPQTPTRSSMAMDQRDPTSSPDELQFEEHYRMPAPVPKTPVFKPAQPVDDNLDTESTASSPLSSPPDRITSPPGSPQDAVADRSQPTAPELEGNNPMDLAPQPEDEHLPSTAARINRSFRQRNAIQLHPYLLEHAQYQSLMKTRGVQPIRVRPGEPQTIHESEDSQNQDFQHENVPPSSDPASFDDVPSSPPRHERARAKSTPTSRPLDDTTQATNRNKDKSRRNILQSKAPGAKRRKVAHINERNEQENIPNTTKPIQVVDNNPSPNENIEGDSVFDVPLSPPLSGAPSSARTKTATGFRWPLGFSPDAMATPITEKGQRSDGVEAMQIDSVSDSENEEPIMEPAQVNISDSEEENPRNDSFELRLMQRQMKGVLPASFARLDREEHERRAREKAERERQKRVLQQERRTGKGVAQRISRKDRPANDEERPRPTTFFLSNYSSAEEEEDIASPMQARLKEPDQRTLEQMLGLDDVGVDDDDDIPEDNRIDYMAPPSTYNRKKKTYTSKRSDRPDRLPKSPRQPTSRSTRSPTNKRQTRITDTAKRPRKTTRRTKPQPPRLGILDADNSTDQPFESQPQFLRVAIRRAQSRRDLGRQSPTKKFLRLATEADSKDANRTLRAWKSGTMKPTASKPGAGTKRQRTALGQRDDRVPQSRVPNSTGHRTNNDPPEQSLPTDTVPEPIVIDDDGPPREQYIGAREDNTNQTTVPPNKPKRSNRNWLVHRGYAISSFRRAAPIPAQLGDVDVPASRSQSTSSFRRNLSVLNADYRQSKKVQNIPLARFLSQPLPPPRTVPLLTEPNVSHRESPRQPEPKEPGRTQPRRAKKKRQPRRIDTETREYRQPLTFENERNDSNSLFAASDDYPTLKGLYPASRQYAVDFDTLPLKVGTYFHESTFIGSGEFSASLKITSRNLDEDKGYATIRFNDNFYNWGAWNETVSSEFGTVFAFIAENTRTPRVESDLATSQSLNLYRSIIGYVTGKLSFIDPIDRNMFVGRCLSVVAGLNSNLKDFDHSNPTNTKRGFDLVAQIEMFTLVFSNQLRQIASHELVDPPKYTQTIDLMAMSTNRMLSLVLSDVGIKNIQELLEDNKYLGKRESGIRQDYPAVDTYVVSHIILHGEVPEKQLTIQHPLSKGIGRPGAPHARCDVLDLEKRWHALFSVLPLQEIDPSGIFQSGLRFEQQLDQWPVVEQLISNVFETYQSNIENQWSSLNRYIRALFHRCFNLIKTWGWRHCKQILDALFDFFAANMLRNLKQEESRGSPKFLDDLDKNPPLEIQSGDTCFQMLLKVLAVGFKYMNSLFDKKKIRNFVWRLLPNHGRTYPKEEALRVEDLDALRNHHDLLCTLYWATPDGCRPRLATIRRLVHPPSSHKEACSINIHSWSRLARFKLSTDEDNSGLAEFADWHGDFTVEILKQHSLARAEVEAQDPSASFFPRQYLEDAIEKNQRHAESLLSDALSCLKSAIDCAKCMDQATVLMEKLPIAKLFGLFNPKIKRLDGVVFLTLDVLLAFTRVATRSLSSLGSEPQVVTTEPNEESQDFGDWSGLIELYDQQMEAGSPGVRYITEEARPAVSQFCSTCFGQDNDADDDIFLKTIECWLSIARIRVSCGLRQWSSYLNPYDEDSWAALRPTEHTRRFMPHFLVKFISVDPTVYSECRVQILTHWMESLVERGLYLKYQHDLTNAILNKDGEGPLFENLPFAINRTAGKYDMTLIELSQRRASLISCVLSNMREHLSSTEAAGESVIESRNQYREMISRMMLTMKRNSEEAGKADGLVPGSYVEFVHRVVQSLQQHCQSICPLDSYFMDPASFPLPASDPTYVVAKLKSYGVRLSLGIAKQLVMFLQSVSERAAVDGQQAYLVDQVYEAMSNTYETGNYQQPTLRCFLLQSVFPAYIELSFDNPAAWVLVRPFLRSTSRVFSDLLFDIDSSDENCITTIVDSLMVYFEAVDRTMQHSRDSPASLENAPVLLTLTSFLETIVSSLPLIDYLDRLGDQANELVSYINTFKQFAVYVASHIVDPATNTTPLDPPPPCSIAHASRRRHSPITPPFFTEARSFATRELQTWFRENWSLHEGRYFVRRGQQSKEVSVDSSYTSVELAKTGFLQALEVFFGALESLDTFFQ